MWTGRSTYGSPGASPTGVWVAHRAWRERDAGEMDPGGSERSPRRAESRLCWCGGGRRGVGRGKLSARGDATRPSIPLASALAAVTLPATPQTSLSIRVERAFAMQPGAADRDGRTHDEGDRRGHDCIPGPGNAAIHPGDCRVGSAPATAATRGPCDRQSRWRSMSRPLRCRLRPTAPNSTVTTTHKMMSQTNKGIRRIVPLPVDGLVADVSIQRNFGGPGSVDGERETERGYGYCDATDGRCSACLTCCGGTSP